MRATTAQCSAAISYLETRVAPQLIPRTVDENLLFGKVDYQINDRNRFNAEMNYLDFRSPNGIQTQGVLTTGNAIGNNADTNVFDRTVKTGLTTIVGSNATVNEFRFGIFKDRQYDPASPSLLPVTEACFLFHLDRKPQQHRLCNLIPAAASQRTAIPDF